MSMLREVWAFLRVRKKFWLSPIIVIVVGFGIIVILAETTAIVPFIYSLF